VAKHRAQPRPDARRHPVDVPSTGVPASRDERPEPQVAPRSARSNVVPRRLLAGVVVLVTAAAGVLALDLAGTPQVAVRAVSSDASAAVGAERAATAVALDRRERAVSRDATRVARPEGAERRLAAAPALAARKRKAALTALAVKAQRQADLIAARERARRIAALHAWHLPVVTGVYHLTSRFGDCSSLWSHCHTGLDFAAPSGTPIHAVAAGRITEVGYAGAYGNRTRMTLTNGTEIWYCHQTSTSVSTGQRVVAGQVIGTVGSTGNTTGPHLHLEIRPNPDVPVDPFAALVAHHLKP
jgi:murein DD-endopeptidase MepM/ murein hydrolase activator NlpD